MIQESIKKTSLEEIRTHGRGYGVEGSGVMLYNNPGGG